MQMKQLIDTVIETFDPEGESLQELEKAVESLPQQDNLMNVEMATRLWNFTTRLGLGQDGKTLSAIARLRYQATVMVIKSGNANLAGTMGLKTSISLARSGALNKAMKILEQVESNLPRDRTLEVLSTKAQLLCIAGDIASAEGILSEIAEQSGEAASSTCWDIALEFFRQGDSRSTRFAAEKAIKFGEGIISSQELSRMYRLLCTCCFEEGADVNTCNNAAQHAHELDPCGESLLLLTRCLAVAGEDAAIVTHLQKIEATSSDWLVEALHTVFEFGDPAVSCKILASYDRLTSADTKLLLLKSQLAPDSVESTDNIRSTLKCLENACEPESKTLSKARDLLWEAGIELWEKGTYNRSEELYSLCLPFSTAPDTAKLLRNIATCQIALGDSVVAGNTLGKIKENDQKKTVLLFQIALLKGDKDAALALVSTLTDEALLQSAAMLAFKTNSEEVAAETLYRAIHASGDQQFILVACRCLLRLNKGQDHQIYRLVTSVKQLPHAEAAYFADSSWNASVSAKPQHEKMLDLLNCCLDLISRMEVPLLPRYLERQRNCNLLSVAAHLQIIQNSQLGDTAKNQVRLTSAMKHIGNVKELGSDLDQTTTLLLLLYELECAVRLDLSEVSSLVSCVASLSYTDCKTLNRVVAICHLGKNKQASQDAIRLAIERHLEEEDPDWRTISQLFIRLAKTSPPQFHKIFRVWSQHANRFPEDESAWMVVEAWNRGVTRDVTSPALTREICTLARQVAQSLPTYRELYVKHMTPYLEQIDTQPAVH